MTVVPFLPIHLEQIELRDEQSAERFLMGNGYGDALDKAGVALTGMADGKVIICAGLAEIWNGRAQAWAMVSKHARPYMRDVTEKCRAFLDSSEFSRIEMDVVSTFAAGIRWTELLGFVFEGRRQKYYPDGSDCDSFARIR